MRMNHQQGTSISSNPPLPTSITRPCCASTANTPSNAMDQVHRPGLVCCVRRDLARWVDLSGSRASQALRIETCPPPQTRRRACTCGAERLLDLELSHSSLSGRLKAARGAYLPPTVN